MTSVGVDVPLSALAMCFEGAIPAVIATASAQGDPNVTYLSKVRMVDEAHIALSNQFFSKTSRNLAANPTASVLLVDPTTFEEYRLTLVYERTERQGTLFEELRSDVDEVAVLHQMQDVFKLRSADIYRVILVERVGGAVHDWDIDGDAAEDSGAQAAVSTGHLAELSRRLARCSDLNTLIDITLESLDELFGYGHSQLQLVDEKDERLFTIASRGYDAQGVGSEVQIGEGTAGLVAQRGTAMRVGSMGQIVKYGRTVRREFENQGGLGPGREIPMPGLDDAQSQLGVPLVAQGDVVGVLLIESSRPVAFAAADEDVLSVAAAILAGSIDAERARDLLADPAPANPSHQDPGSAPQAPPTLVRFFPVDGSVFVDGDYLIKGVAGRILWVLLGHHEREGRLEFTNREIRLDPSLELPEFRDNLESRLILLRRRLDERNSPLRIEKTGRGRFRLELAGPIALSEVASA